MLAVLLLGSQPILVVRPWPLALAPVAIPGIHVQPVPGFDSFRQALDNLMGPGLAAILLMLVVLNIPGRTLRAAVFANVLGLVFFAIIEPAYVMLDGRLELEFLTAPEFNYGVPLLLALIVAGRSAMANPPPRRPPDTDLVGGPGFEPGASRSRTVRAAELRQPPTPG